MDRESINVVAELLFRAAARSQTHAGRIGRDGAGEPARVSVEESRDGANGRRRQRRQRPLAARPRHGALDGAAARLRAPGAEWGPTFHAALPVEGESGTLKRHGKGTPSRGNLHAKTGTTNTVAALGGYVTAKNGEVLAFSLIYNGTDRWNAKAAMDQIGATMAEFVRE